jgi:hypothetical protein
MIRPSASARRETPQPTKAASSFHLPIANTTNGRLLSGHLAEIFWCLIKLCRIKKIIEEGSAFFLDQPRTEVVEREKTSKLNSVYAAPLWRRFSLQGGG